MNLRTRTLPKDASWLINLGACEESRRLKHRRAAIYPLAGFLSAFMMSAPAQAACGQWDIPAKMNLSQSNTNYYTHLQVAPVDGGFTGKADAGYFVEENLSGESRRGVVDGTVEGPNVNFTIHWEFGVDRYTATHSTGVYTGTIGSLGRMSGTTYDAFHPEVRAEWFADEVLQCHVTAAAPPRPAPPPVTLGRVHLPSAPDKVVKVDTDPKQFELKPPAPLEVIPPAHLEVIPH